MPAVIRTLWRNLRKDSSAQDLSEYCLLTALVALIALGVFIHVSGGVHNLWDSAGGAMATASSTNTTANGAASAPAGH